MAEEIKKIIQVDTSQSVKSIKQLRTEVAALTDEIEDLEIGSSDYASKIKELTSVQNELDVATQSMQGTTINSVKAFDSLNQIAGGLAGGISAVSATFTLFGKDSENLQKTMVKLQAAIAIVQGIGGLKGLGEGVLNAVKSFKALGVSMTAASVGTKGLTVSLQGMKAALVSTGIGALIVGLGLLVEKLISAKQSANELSDVLDRVARQRKVDSIAIENIAVGLEDRLLALDLQERRRLISKEERLKKEQELYKEAIEVLDDYNGFTSKTFAQIDSLILRSDGTKKLIQTLGYDWKDWSKAILGGVDTTAKMVRKVSKTLYSEYKSGNEQLLSLLDDEQKAVLDAIVQNEEEKVNLKESYNKKIIELDYEILYAQIDSENKRQDEADKAEKERIAKQQQRLKAEAEYNAKLLGSIDDFYKENYDKSLTAQQRELGELAIHYGNQLQLLIEAKDKELITEDEYNKRRLQIVSTYDKEREKVNLSYLEESLNRRLELINDSISRESQLYANKEAALTAKRGVYETSVYDLGLFATGGEFYQSKQNIEDEYEAAKKFNEDLYNLTVARVNRENELLGEQLVIYKEMLDNKLILQQDYENQVASIRLQQEANDILIANASKQRNEDDLQAFKDVQEKKQQALQATASVASSLAGAAANFAKQESQNDKKSEKEREKAFKVYKALATTQAVIDTVSSAQSAYKSMVGIPYVGPVLAPIAAAAAIALGIANIRSIQQETLPSSEGSASVSAPTALNAPPIEYSRTLLGDQETENLNKPIKCYVLESDITDTQNKVATVEANASF